MQLRSAAEQQFLLTIAIQVICRQHLRIGQLRQASACVRIEDDEPGVVLDEQSVKLLLESQAKIRAGEFVTAEEMIKELDDA